MSLFTKDKSQGEDKSDKHCFNCGKELKEGHYTKTNNRYCCEKCCSDEGKKKGEVCEFC